jgi:hypothetical protein
MESFLRQLTDMSNNIGKIVMNLQSLELSLRLVLDRLQNLDGGTEIDLMDLTVGEWVSENYFTNYNTLNQLIKKFNSELRSRGLTERVDDSIVELRDAIAHGRVLALNPEGPYRMVKFSQSKDNKVQVVRSLDITKDWLSEQVSKTNSEIRKVITISQILGLDCFPE